MRDSDWMFLNELYNTKNITKTAERLYISQPSLTKRLRAIEEEFGCVLVSRTQAGVEFTPEGELLAKSAAQYLNFNAGSQKQTQKNTGTGKNSHPSWFLLHFQQKTFA